MIKIRKRKGFTLAELLIVIAIIAILIAIAVPVFSTSMKRAQKAADDGNFRAAKSSAVTALLSGEIEVENEDGTLRKVELKGTATGQWFIYTASGHWAEWSNSVPNPVKAKYDGTVINDMNKGYASNDTSWTKNNYGTGHKPGASLYLVVQSGATQGIELDKDGSAGYDDVYILKSEPGTIILHWR